MSAPPAKSTQPGPSDAIQKAMEATLAVIDMPPPAAVTAPPVAATKVSEPTAPVVQTTVTGSGTTEASPTSISDRFVYHSRFSILWSAKR